MITYNPAFDLYHTIFRMAHIILDMDDGETMEVERVRIWDFFLLFPDKLHSISLRIDETDVREQRSHIGKTNNPYENCGDVRKFFEWIKPYQTSALSCLVSCGILSKDEYLKGHVRVSNRQALDDFCSRAGDISDRERQVLLFLSGFSRYMPLTGEYGLKYRTHLLESKYDAE
jgi:hypothetical protein